MIFIISLEILFLNATIVIRIPGTQQIDSFARNAN